MTNQYQKVFAFEVIIKYILYILYYIQFERIVNRKLKIRRLKNRKAIERLFYFVVRLEEIKDMFK